MLLNIYILVMSQTIIGTLFISTSSVHSESLGCGVAVASSESRGSALKHPKSGAWPWMAAILTNVWSGNMDIFCSGVLITKRHVLTTAHCVESLGPAKYEVRVGNSDWSKGEKHSVEQIKVHEQYKAGQYHDDVAILTLDRPVDDPNVNVVCLPEGKMATGNLTGSRAAVAGWNPESSGLQKVQRDGVSKLLSSATYEPIISNWECNRRYSKMKNYRRLIKLGISPALLCAVPPQNTCLLSGSPLMLKGEGKWQAVGIMLFGYGCGKSEYPEGFTRVSYYLDWIKKNIKS